VESVGTAGEKQESKPLLERGSEGRLGQAPSAGNRPRIAVISEVGSEPRSSTSARFRAVESTHTLAN
jgi:hypothetical protein